MSSKSKSFQGKDSFTRMNFLYQASFLMAGINDVLSCYYGSMCRNIGKKCVLRLEPGIKRTLCKKCGLSQRPGITSEMEASSEGNDNIDVRISIKCTRCLSRKNFRVNPKYDFWLDDSKSVAEVMTLKKKKKTKARRKKDQKESNKLCTELNKE